MAYCQRTKKIMAVLQHKTTEDVTQTNGKQKQNCSSHDFDKENVDPAKFHQISQSIKAPENLSDASQNNNTYSENNDYLLLLNIPEITDPLFANTESFDDVINDDIVEIQPTSTFCAINKDNLQDLDNINVFQTDQSMSNKCNSILCCDSQIVEVSTLLDDLFETVSESDINKNGGEQENVQEVNSSLNTGNTDMQTSSDEEKNDDPDFTPDLEPPGADIGENSDGNDEGTTINKTVKKRNKRHLVNDEQWNENKKKRKREKGEEYFGKRKVDSKWIYDVKREKREIQPHCNCKLSLKNSALKCRLFSEPERLNIFRNFWANMTWAERKIYVSFLVDLKDIKRPRNRVNETSRRAQTLIYYMKREKERVRVCKQMFLNTHNVKENMVLDWLQKDKNQDNSTKIDGETNEETCHLKPDRYKNLKNNLRHFFNELAKMESHYCRSSSSKLYLEPNWRSKSALYKFYKQWCQTNSTLSVSIASFSHVFEEMNLSLFQPKKDECDICVAHRTGNLAQDIYEIHQLKKKEAREEKAKDKESDNKVFCMDLQSVLLAPKSNTSSLYFKTKLIVHNFTIFNLKTKDGFCYLWHEASGGVSASDYATIICRFIESHVSENLQPNEKVILYSDGCTSQNRNSILANALINLSVKCNIDIEQKFLEKGHTQMEADAMHSTIERKLRHVNINVPADYVEICLRARENPAPYKVTYLNYDFFKDFSKVNFLKSLRPGKKVGDPLVTHIRALQYRPDSSIWYKLRHTEEYQELHYSRVNKDTRKNLACEINDLPQLYNGPIPIKREKFLHLQDLKRSLEKDYHDFYDRLTYK